MPASIALVATSVRAAPSVGSSTIASTLSLMNVSTCAICWLASLVPSAVLRSMSSYFLASSSAELLMAASHPWSAAGPENPMVTVSPGSSLPETACGCESPDAPLSSALLVHPVRTTRAAIATPATSRNGRFVGRDMVLLLSGGAGMPGFGGDPRGWCDGPGHGAVLMGCRDCWAT